MNRCEAVFFSIIVLSIATVISVAICMYHWKEAKFAEAVYLISIRLSLAVVLVVG